VNSDHVLVKHHPRDDRCAEIDDTRHQKPSQTRVLVKFHSSPELHEVPNEAMTVPGGVICSADLIDLRAVVVVFGDVNKEDAKRIEESCDTKCCHELGDHIWEIASDLGDGESVKGESQWRGVHLVGQDTQKDKDNESTKVRDRANSHNTKLDSDWDSA
jgi:hypothetical protein